MAQQQTGSNDIRILSVVWYKVLPPRFGGQKGVALFNEYLGRVTSVTCLCSKNNEAQQTSYVVVALLPVGKSQFLNPLSWRRIYVAAKKLRVTHLILEFPYYGIAGVLCKKLLRTKLVVHEHNIETFRFRKQQKRWWKALLFLEGWTLKKADAVFFKTEIDRETAVHKFKISKNKTTLVPYGIEVKDQPDKRRARALLLQRHKLLPETKLLLFTATLDYGPNARAMEDLVNKLVPFLNDKRIDYQIIVCGRIVFDSFAYLKNMKNENVLYAGNVPDVETYFAAADVFLNPVLSGGGVQTKTIDALCFHLNVVCFEGMEEGIAGADDKIFVAPQNDWNAFANATLQALESDSPTPPAFFEHHDWKRIAANAFDFLQTT